MARTYSQMIPLGSIAPSFRLLDVVSDEARSLDDLAGKDGTVVMFICNHCPYVKHVLDEIVSIARDYGAKGIGFVGISSNDASQYPDDAPSEMKSLAQTKRFPFAYLYDDTQDVARAYQAACTPDFFLFDAELRCVYRGQLDDSRPKTEIPVSGKDLRRALDCLLSREPMPSEQTPSMGCNIKWK